VPAGLWAALIARDRGCAWPGCDAPPAWCQAAHGNTPYRHDGKLKLSDAALLCLQHHRRFDHDGWELHIEGPTVTFHPTHRTDQTDPTGHLTTSATTTRPATIAEPTATIRPTTVDKPDRPVTPGATTHPATADEPDRPTVHPMLRAAVTRTATRTAHHRDRSDPI
jgi:hypothetical protein